MLWLLQITTLNNIHNIVKHNVQKRYLRSYLSLTFEIMKKQKNQSKSLRKEKNAGAQKTGFISLTYHNFKL